MAATHVSDMKSADLVNPLYRTERKRYVMLLDRFEQYSIRPHVDALKEQEKELDRQARVDLVDLSRIREQALCPEDVQCFEKRGEPLRAFLLRAVASLFEKHPEVKKPVRHQEDVLLNDDEKEQGYALAADELQREKDRLADQEDLLLRVETIHNEVEQVVGVMDQFWTILEAQGKTVETIEGNISEANLAVIEATAELSLAAKYKTGIYPVVGAVVGELLVVKDSSLQPTPLRPLLKWRLIYIFSGYFLFKNPGLVRRFTGDYFDMLKIRGVLGGPLGMLTGMKAAMVFGAAAGTFLGYKGGSVWKRRTLMSVPVINKPRDESDIPQVDETNIARG